MPDNLSGELAAIIWLRSLAGLPSGANGGVASTLPADLSKWPDGFVVVEGVVAGPGITTGTHRRRDRTLVRTHYVKADSQRPRWHRSAALGEVIVAATLPNNFQPVELTPAAPLDDYPTLVVHAARVIGGPFRALGEPGNHAAHNLTLELDWHQA